MEPSLCRGRRFQLCLRIHCHAPGLLTPLWLEKLETKDQEKVELKYNFTWFILAYKLFWFTIVIPQTTRLLQNQVILVASLVVGLTMTRGPVGVSPRSSI